MPLRFADVALYLIAAAIPLVLLALFSVFRWRYLRAVERAIHADSAGTELQQRTLASAASRTNR